jgi:hypothetical protein
MTTITQEFDRLAQSVNEMLTNHHQQLQLQKQEITSLTQLLNSCRHNSLDSHCLSSIERLTTLLDFQTQSIDRIDEVLNTLTQAKDAQSLTIDERGELATSMKLDLTQLAQRLKIDRVNLLSKATHSSTNWSKLMTSHPDPDGYQWKFPGLKRGFYHQTNLQIVGTKATKLESVSVLN